MIIYCLRHGRAGPNLTTDEARTLTVEGRNDTASVLNMRVDQMQDISQIWASPLVRAQQTAEIAQDFFPSLAIQTTPLLIPEANLSQVLTWLAVIHESNRHGAVLLVTHQPLVGALVNQLCHKADNYYAMDTSSLAAIELDVVAAGMGNLLWLEHAPGSW